MNAEKLAKLQSQVRIGGKGTARRKKKVVHRSSTTDDKKLQSSLKKLAVNNISGIEEVNMIKDDGSVIHFNNPKVQASLNANTFAVSGHAENKQITEMLPNILNHLGAEGFNQLKRLAVSSVNPGTASATGIDEDDDDVPQLVEDFETASRTETVLDKVVEAAEAVDSQPEEVTTFPAVETPEVAQVSDPEVAQVSEGAGEAKAVEPPECQKAVTVCQPQGKGDIMPVPPVLESEMVKDTETVRETKAETETEALEGEHLVMDKVVEAAEEVDSQPEEATTFPAVETPEVAQVSDPEVARVSEGAVEAVTVEPPECQEAVTVCQPQGKAAIVSAPSESESTANVSFAESESASIVSGPSVSESVAIVSASSVSESTAVVSDSTVLDSTVTACDSSMPESTANVTNMCVSESVHTVSTPAVSESAAILSAPSAVSETAANLSAPSAVLKSDAPLVSESNSETETHEGEPMAATEQEKKESETPKDEETTVEASKDTTVEESKGATTSDSKEDTVQENKEDTAQEATTPTKAKGVVEETVQTDVKVEEVDQIDKEVKIEEGVLAASPVKEVGAADPVVKAEE